MLFEPRFFALFVAALRLFSSPRNALKERMVPQKRIQIFFFVLLSFPLFFFVEDFCPQELFIPSFQIV